MVTDAVDTVTTFRCTPDAVGTDLVFGEGSRCVTTFCACRTFGCGSVCDASGVLADHASTADVDITPFAVDAGDDPRIVLIAFGDFTFTGGACFVGLDGCAFAIDACLIIAGYGVTQFSVFTCADAVAFADGPRAFTFGCFDDDLRFDAGIVAADLICVAGDGGTPDAFSVGEDTSAVSVFGAAQGCIFITTFVMVADIGIVF